MEKVKLCVLNLYKIGAVKFGEFKLKSGVLSPIYIDLRLIISYPKLLREIAELVWEKIHALSFDRICPVPYTALPIATAISLDHNIPMLMRRKEVKDYGTKKAIEGVFEKGQKCLVVEDLITSGISIFETIEPLENEGLKIEDIVVLLDRQQGGKKHIEERGYRLHSVVTLKELLSILEQEKKIDQATVKKVYEHLFPAS